MKLWSVLEESLLIELLVLAPDEKRAIELAKEKLRRTFSVNGEPFEPEQFETRVIADNLNEEGVVCIYE